jgi:Arc/MetJ family transcription regulator
MTTMSRTNIEIDEDLIRRAMQMYGCKTKREAVDLALRELVGNPMTLEEARSIRGIGWEGDLKAMRTSKHVDWDDRR